MDFIFQIKQSYALGGLEVSLEEPSFEIEPIKAYLTGNVYFIRIIKRYMGLQNIV